MGLKLSEYSIDKAGTIIEIIESKISNKLIEFGVLPGVRFKVISKAPFKGPIFIQLDNNRIAIRRKEAAFIIVE